MPGTSRSYKHACSHSPGQHRPGPIWRGAPGDLGELPYLSATNKATGCPGHSAPWMGPTKADPVDRAGTRRWGDGERPWGQQSTVSLLSGTTSPSPCPAAPEHPLWRSGFQPVWGPQDGPYKDGKEAAQKDWAQRGQRPGRGQPQYVACAGHWNTRAAPLITRFLNNLLPSPQVPPLPRGPSREAPFTQCFGYSPRLQRLPLVCPAPPQGLFPFCPLVAISDTATASASRAFPATVSVPWCQGHQGAMSRPDYLETPRQPCYSPAPFL